MSRDARSRLFLGVGIPVAALVFLGLLIVAFSRILLAVPESAAPWVALLFAAVILVGCTLAAMIPGTRGFTFLISSLVAMIVVGGVAGWVIGPREVHSLVEDGEHATAEEPEENQPAFTDEPVAGEEETAEQERAEEQEAAGDEGEGDQPGAAPSEASIGAVALEFTTEELSLTAGAPTALGFDNQDEGIPHNVSIYTDQGGEQLFLGDVITGPAQITYDVQPLEAGTYFFQCDVHPTTMTGTVTVG